MSVYNIGRLDMVHPDLIRLVNDVGSTDDIEVIQGARTIEREQADIDAGRSALKDPAHSKHVLVPDTRPLAEAVDLARYPVDWADLDGFKSLGSRMKERAATLGIGLVWGGDWLSLHDYDHFELATA